MFVKFCDACGKQINRYETSASIMYDIRVSVNHLDEKGVNKGCGVVALDFCPECYAKIETAINAIMEELPTEFNAIVRRDDSIIN